MDRRNREGTTERGWESDSECFSRSLETSILIPSLCVGIRIRQVPRNFVGFIVTRCDAARSLRPYPIHRSFIYNFTRGKREGGEFRCVKGMPAIRSMYDIDNRNLACGKKRALLAPLRAITHRNLFARSKKQIAHSLRIADRVTRIISTLSRSVCDVTRRGKYYHVHRGVSLQDYLSTLTARVYSPRSDEKFPVYLWKLVATHYSPLLLVIRRCDPIGKFLRFSRWYQCCDATWSRTSRNDRTWRTRVSTRTWRAIVIIPRLGIIIYIVYY